MNRVACASGAWVFFKSREGVEYIFRRRGGVIYFLESEKHARDVVARMKM